MSVLSVAEARAAGVGGEDAAIQLAIDDVESEIVARFGPYAPGPITELLEPAERQTRVYLRRRIDAVLSIVEWETSNVIGGTSITLATDDYRVVSGFALERLATGTNPRSYWLPYGLEISYVPVDDTARRKMATIDVLRLEVGAAGSGAGSASGLTSRRIGDYAESFGAGAASSGSAAGGVSADRSRILRRLRPKAIVFA